MSRAKANLDDKALTRNIPGIADAKFPLSYARAKDALAACLRIDEALEIADRMAALAVYAKQADDGDLQRMVNRIRARAMQRCGDLMRQVTPSSGGRPKTGAAAGPSSRKAVAEEAGMSVRQQKTALRVASVPRDEFEAAVESDDPPTVTELAERGRRPMVPRAPGLSPSGMASLVLSVIAQLDRVAEEVEIHTLAQECSAGDVADLRERVPFATGWLSRLDAAIKRRTG